MSTDTSAAAKIGHGPLPLKEKIAYAFGDFGNGFMFDLGQAFLLKFFTDVAGIPAVDAAFVFVFTKIFDAFMDPIAGAFIDSRKVNGKGGRFRGIMFRSSIALALLTVLTFLTPGATPTVNLIYAYVSYMAWGVLYSFTNVPYGSLASVMTQDAQQRAQLASFRQAGSVSALLITGVAFMPIVFAVGNPRTGYAIAAVVMSIVGVLGFLIARTFTVERVPVARTHVKLTPKDFITTVGSNRPLLVLILMTLFSISAYNLATAMIVYFTQYYLGDKTLVSIVNLISIGASILVIPAVPLLARILGKKRTAILGFGLASGAYLVNLIVPTNVVLFTVLLSLSYIGVALPNSIQWAFVSDIIDYGQWKTGTRREGITYSVFNLSRKLAQALAASLAGFGLASIGYHANQVQTPATLTGMKFLQVGFPAIGLALAGCILAFLYPLSDKMHADLVKEIHERDAGVETLDDVAALGLTAAPGFADPTAPETPLGNEEGGR
jgi:glycoside/pentoside/hexuronide:cation symporter, GPH family